MLTEEQLAKRRTGLTSTDMSAVLGLSPYKSALEVYLDKVQDGPGVPDNESMWWGRALEPIVTARYELAIVPDLDAMAWGDTVAHPEHKWMLATPDGYVWDAYPAHSDCGKICGLECKTAWSIDQAKRWGGTSIPLPPPDPDDDYYATCARIAEKNADCVPGEYYVQCAWCMAVTGLDRWDIAALIAGGHGAEFRVYTLRRDPVQEAKLIEIGRRFWVEHVLERVPPPPDGSRSAAHALAYMHQSATETVMADDMVEGWGTDYAGLADQGKSLLSQAELPKQQIAAWLERAGAKKVTGEFGAAQWIEPEGKRPYVQIYPKEGR